MVLYCIALLKGITSLPDEILYDLGYILNSIELILLSTSYNRSDVVSTLLVWRGGGGGGLHYLYIQYIPLGGIISSSGQTVSFIDVVESIEPFPSPPCIPKEEEIGSRTSSPTIGCGQSCFGWGTSVVREALFLEGIDVVIVVVIVHLLQYRCRATGYQ